MKLLTNHQDANKSIIELKDDDADALEGVLQYIYTFGWTKNEQQKSDWRFQLNVSIAAEKYLVSKLPEEAYNAFNDIIKCTRDPNQALDMAIALREYKERDERITPLIDNLLSTHMEAISKGKRFRDLMDNDKEFRWWYIEHSTLTADLVEMEIWTCKACGPNRIHKKGTFVTYSPSMRYCCYSGGQPTMQECWVKS